MKTSEHTTSGRTEKLTVPLRKGNERTQDATAPEASDWIRIGELQVQAKSKRSWQMVAILAVIGLIAVIMTDIWLYMDRSIQIERVTSHSRELLDRSKSLSGQLDNATAVAKKYAELTEMMKNEINQLSVEKAIIQAQIGLLSDELKSLKAPEVQGDKADTEQTDPADSGEETTTRVRRDKTSAKAQ